MLRASRSRPSRSFRVEALGLLRCLLGFPIMAFTDIEIAEHTITLEEHFWSHRRPPLHLRDKVREGQRFTDQSIELFMVRPALNRPSKFTEESIAKVQHMPRLRVWRIFWKRADNIRARRSFTVITRTWHGKFQDAPCCDQI